MRPFSEPALKRAQKSYRNQGKKERQAAAFPELQAEIESKRKELYKPYRWPDVASRKRPDFIEELRKLSEGRIVGTPEEHHMFFESVIAKPFNILSASGPKVVPLQQFGIT